MAIADLYIGSNISNPQYHFTQFQILDSAGNIAVSFSGSELSFDAITIRVDNPSVSVAYATPAYYYTQGNLVAKMYVSRVVQVQQTQFDVVLVSSVGLLDKMTHYGGLYNGEYLDAVVGDILSASTQGTTPSGTYQEIEYLECSGSQYLNVGITMQENFRIETDVLFRNFAANQCVFGTFAPYKSYGFGALSSRKAFVINSTSYSDDPVSNSNYATFSQSITTNVKYHINYNYNISAYYTSYDHYTQFNGETAYVRASSMSASTVYLAIGAAARYSSGTTTYSYPLRGRIYTVKVYDGNGDVYANLVPVRRKSDNVLGLYDNVRYQFYTNAGSGTFTAGPDVGSSSSYVINFSIDPGVANQTVHGWLPVDTKRNNLHKLLFAYGLSIVKDNNGDAYITSIGDSTAVDITDGDVYNTGTISSISYASEVRVTEHSYVYDSSVSDTEIYNSNGQYVQNKLVVFSEAPIYENSITGNGLTILYRTVNYAIVTGTGSLSGKPYVHYTQVESMTNPVATDQRVISTQDDTLISIINGANLLNHLYEYYVNGYVIKNSIVLTNQKCGTKYRFTDPFKNRITAYLASMAITGSAKVKADCEFIAGYTPVSASQSYDHYVLLTSNGTFNTPAEALTNRKMTIVLIGGGTGGDSGLAGNMEDATNGAVINEFNMDYKTSLGGDGGIGGEGGSGGSGGRVLIYTIHNPQSSYYYSCGSGGSGAGTTTSVNTHNTGSSGGNTTFGSYTSANGATMDSGYINPFTNIVYAKKGVDGVAGGDGGKYVVGGEPGAETYSTSGKSVTFNGVTYQGGSKGSDSQVSWSLTAYGAPGAGAVVGQNGNNGGSGSHDSYSANGGSGANGLTPTRALSGSTHGCGGNGGHGGSGGAGGGNVYAATYDSSGLSKFAGSRGIAGSGGAGGHGATGCIIVYY